MIVTLAVRHAPDIQERVVTDLLKPYRATRHGTDSRLFARMEWADAELMERELNAHPGITARIIRGNEHIAA